MLNIFKKEVCEVITIGDTVIDAFIKLKEAHITCKLDNTACEICMKYGDKIPFESVEVINGVGNSANAAVSMSRLGVKAGIYTNLGDDAYATDCLNHFKSEKVLTTYITKNKDKKTNYHYVLWYGADRTILIKHEVYDYLLPDISNIPWIYLSSLGENSLEFHGALGSFLKEHPDKKLVFQPGTYQIRFGKDKLKDIYANTFLFFCNKEEAQTILDTKETNIALLMQKIAALGPKHVILTDGPNGAYAWDGTHSMFVPPYPDPKPPFERTGAGDAFASTVTTALILGKPLEEALLWAGINSTYVVQQLGAQKGLLTQEEVKAFLEKAPANYKVKTL